MNMNTDMISFNTISSSLFHFFYFLPIINLTRGVEISLFAFAAACIRKPSLIGCPLFSLCDQDSDVDRRKLLYVEKLIVTILSTCSIRRYSANGDSRYKE